MKRIFILLATVLFGVVTHLNAQNQFSNNSFENWNTATTLPTDWSTFSINVPIVGDVALGSISRITDAQDGNFATSLTPEQIDPMYASALKILMPDLDLSGVYFPAILTNAKINLSLENISSIVSLLSSLSSGEGGDIFNFDINNLQNNEIIKTLLTFITDGLDVKSDKLRPTSISGYYKFKPINNANDDFLIAALLLKNINGQRVPVGGGAMDYNESLSNEYVKFTLPLYYGVDDADELIFFAVSATDAEQPTSAGSLYLDNVSIAYEGYTPVNLNDVQETTTLSIYPNPTANKSFRLNTEKPQNVQIFNAMGVMIKNILSYEPQSEIVLKESGVYFVKVDGKTLKLVIE